MPESGVKNLLLVWENHCPHKNKISTPPFQKNLKYTHLKRGILWVWRVFLEKEAKIPGTHKIGAAIHGPRSAGGKSTDISIAQV